MSYGNPTFERPAGVKIVDMCIYVDEHMKDILTAKGTEKRKLENTIVQYLYHIVDSLAKRKHYFIRYKDYDEFALYCAGEFFIIFRNKLERAGQISRGKEVVPVKSCLNFIKSVLYPYKVVYQRNQYDACIWPDMLSNADQFKENLRDNIRQEYIRCFDDRLADLIKVLPKNIKDMLLAQCPYKTQPAMLEKIYTSVLLTFITNITLPNRFREKIDSSKNLDSDKKIKFYHKVKDDEIVLWHLPDHMQGYIQMWYRKAKRIVTDELVSSRSRTDLSDEIVDGILSTAFTTYENEGDM